MELFKRPILFKYFLCCISSLSIHKNSLYTTSRFSISAIKLIGLISIGFLLIEKHSLLNNSLYAFFVSISFTLAYKPTEYPPAPTS